MNSVLLWLGGILIAILTVLFAAPMGFSYALLNAPAQTVLHERAPPEMRGRIFATQVVSANFVSLLPLIVVGAITDFAGITAVLLGVAAFLLLFAVVSTRVAGLRAGEGATQGEEKDVSSSIDTSSRLS